MSVHVIGDSHGNYLFARATNVAAHCVPGHTMHRVGRDGAAHLMQQISPTPDDTLIFVFGEIDVRCHLLRVAAMKGWSLEATVSDLARRYIAALSDTVGIGPHRPKVCIIGVVPPIDPFLHNADLPVVGTLAERLVAWFLLNEALEARSREAGFTFVPIPKFYRKRDGSLKRRYSDCHAHIAKDCTEVFVQSLERKLSVPLAFRPLPRRSHRIRMLMRLLAVANHDYAAMWVLGETNINV